MSFSNNEKKMNITKDKIINIKCLIKKWYELVFSLSLAIIEVETKEKKRPKKNKNKTKNKIILSVFFHQL